MDKSYYKAQPPFQPSGKYLHPGAGKIVQVCNIQTFLNPCIQTGARQPQHTPEEGQIFPCGQGWIKCDVLGDKTYALFYNIKVSLYIKPCNQQFAGAWLKEAYEHGQEGGFACPVGAEQSKKTPFPYCEVNAVYSRPVSARIGLTEPCDFNDVFIIHGIRAGGPGLRFRLQNRVLLSS